MDTFFNTYKESDYKTLFQEFYSALVHFAITIINDHKVAEDIVQEIFVQLWEKELKFENQLAIRTYLYRSTQNRCYNHLRDLKTQQNHQQKITDEIQKEETQSILHSIIKEEVYRQLLASINHLPPQCKKICMLTLDGKKPSEIAQELNLNVETVKKQKKIALKRIRDEFGPLSTISIFLSHYWIHLS